MGKHLLIRDEIEDIIKDKHIDRERFHEYPKTGYTEILRKFCFTFCDLKAFPVKDFRDLHVHGMHFRSDLKSRCIDSILRTGDRCGYMESIREAMPDKEKKIFIITDDGWVYEGDTDETFFVLVEAFDLNDFYIVSSKFLWFIAVSSLNEKAVLYER